MNRLALAAALLTTTAPLAAETHTIAPGDDAGTRLQEALILAARAINLRLHTSQRSCH